MWQIWFQIYLTQPAGQRCPLPGHTDGRGGGRRPGLTEAPWKPAQFCLSALVRKSPQPSRSSEAPWLLRADGFFHKAAPWPWQAVSETSVTSGRLQEEACKSLEAALCSLQEKLRAKFISPWWRASTLWCWEMKGYTGLVSSRCRTLWPLLTSSCCLSFQSTIHQIGQRKEKSTVKHPFPHYMTSK